MAQKFVSEWLTFSLTFTVDFALVNRCGKNDIVVTQDYGVAAMALGKGAYPIHQKGFWYTDKNIDRLLAERHVMKKARRSKQKIHLHGPCKRTPEDDDRFSKSLEDLIHHIQQQREKSDSSGVDNENPFDLERFKDAQRRDYKQALRELKNGRKESHWIWYIFSQIRGLGFSMMSQKYAISSLDEAKAYLEDEILRQRLLACCQALLDLDTSNPGAVMGYPDNLKLQSSMTLFQLAAPDGLMVFQQVLDKYYDGKMDANTIDILKTKK